MNTDNEAVIRAFSPINKTVTLSISIWKNTAKVHLKAPPEGASYIIRREGKKIIIYNQPLKKI
jgi:hypothetical protein